MHNQRELRSKNFENISFANPLKKPATEKAKMTLKENQSITNI